MGVLEWQWTYVMNITGKSGDFLNILVENQAHITFGSTINDNLKVISLFSFSLSGIVVKSPNLEVKEHERKIIYFSSL